MKFIDEAKIHIKSGAGGAGCVSFRRERNIPFGGPDGGNGGRGGHIIARAVANLNTLIDYRFSQHFKAKTGGHGMGRQKSGANSADIYLNVPVGTQIFDEDGDIIIADLSEIGEEIILARGGKGGVGNMHFKTSTNQAPRRATPGEPLEELSIWLKLKLFCDAGLVGMPNAGKSTFLSKISRAKPKIADYPFTTLVPQLGVIYIDEQEFVMADIPGLIEGASTGHGLGVRFLKHIERCRIILHLIDITNDNVCKIYSTIRNELEEYSKNLADKTEIIALNKCDLADDDEITLKKEELEELTGKKIHLISTLKNENIKPILREILAKVKPDKIEKW